MRVYRVLVSRGPGLEVEVHEQEGETVISTEDRRRMVRLENGHYFDQGPDWRPSRLEALRMAAARLEDAAASTLATLDQVLNRIVNIERRPLPAGAAVGSGESAAGGREVTPAA